jgi:hypothetical protein
MTALIEPYREILEDYYEIYSELLLDYMQSVPTTTYVLTILTICIPPIIALIIYELDEARLRAEQPKGCRKLGLKIESNLLNEFDKKFSEGRPPSTEETSAEWWRLKSLWIYPVKSCKGVELNRGTVIATGMEYDRQFTFAQLKSPIPAQANTPYNERAAHKWEFITQRQFPLLAKVRTEMWVPDQSVDTYTPHDEDVESGGVIIMSFPCQKAGWRGQVAKWGAAVKGTVPEKHFRVPFDPSPVQIEKAGYSFEDMTIWKDTVSALNLELEIPEELRYYLGISNKLGLFRVDNSKLREVHRNAPKREELGYQPVTGFQDAVSFTIISSRSSTNTFSILSILSTWPASGTLSVRCPRSKEPPASPPPDSEPTSSSPAQKPTTKTPGAASRSATTSMMSPAARHAARCPTSTKQPASGTRLNPTRRCGASEPSTQARAPTSAVSACKWSRSRKNPPCASATRSRSSKLAITNTSSNKPVPPPTGRLSLNFSRLAALALRIDTRPFPPRTEPLIIHRANRLAIVQRMRIPPEDKPLGLALHITLLFLSICLCTAWELVDGFVCLYLFFGSRGRPLLYCVRVADEGPL